MRRARPWIFGTACGIVITMLPGLPVVVAVLYFPAMAAHGLSGGARLPSTRAMLLMTSAASLQPLLATLEAGGSIASALATLTDPAVILLGWAACGCGWFVSQAADIASRIAATVWSRGKVRALLAERGDLTREWEIDTLRS